MKKEVLVFIFDGYTDWEGAYACFELNQPETGYVIKTLALDKTSKVSQGGFIVNPDYTIANYPANFSMLILIGGDPWLGDKNNKVLKVVKHAVEHQIPVAAICNAAGFLAANGFLDEIRHTGNTLAFIKKNAPRYKGDAYFIEQQAVCDRGIITANGTAVLEFTKEVLHCLEAMPQARIDEWYRLHKAGLYPVEEGKEK